MVVLVQIVSVLAAVVMGYWGATYLANSATSNSAIHETAGMVGLSMALLLLGLAVGLGQLSVIVRRLGLLRDAVDDQAGESSSVRQAKALLAPAVLVLVALSHAGGGLLKHLEVQRIFLRKAAPKWLNNVEEDEVFAWLHAQPRDGESLAKAISSLAALPEAVRKELARAATETVRQSTADGHHSDSQTLLLNRVVTKR